MLQELRQALGPCYERLQQGSLSWDAFVGDVLLHKGVLRLCQTWLAEMAHPDISARDFLALYILVFFPEVHGANTPLQDASEAVLDAFHAPRPDARRIAAALAAWRPIYQAWKRHDKEDTAQQLARMYWECELNYRLHMQAHPDEPTADAAEAAVYQEKTRLQHECLEALRQMRGLEAFHQFTPVFIDTQASDHLICVLRTAFWDRIQEEMRRSPPNAEPLLAALAELRGIVHDLVPLRPSVLEEYDDYFDIDFLRQRIADGSANATFWAQRCTYLVALLQSLDSAAREDQHAEMLHTWEMHMGEHETALEPCIALLGHCMSRFLELQTLCQAVRRPPSAPESPDL